MQTIEEKKANMRAWYHTHKNDPEFKDRRKADRERNRKSGETNRRSKVYFEKKQYEVFALYGGKCGCCGETNEKFLTVDHVNEDGSQDRGKTGYKKSGTYLLLSVLRNPSKFQLLCFNCNCARSIRGGGTCPHELESTDVFALVGMC